MSFKNSLRLVVGGGTDLLRAGIRLVYSQFADPGIRAISYAAGADVFYDSGEDLAPLIKMLRKLAMALVDAETEKMVA